MKPDSKWAHAVRVARRASLDAEIRNPSANGRATAFEFAGNARPWVGKASLAPGGTIALHHHGRHEIVLFIIAGDLELRWGAQLEYTASVAAGDFAYFSPGVPHEERNLSVDAATEFLVVRSDSERVNIAIASHDATHATGE